MSARLHISESEQIGQVFREGDLEGLQLMARDEQALRSEEEAAAYRAMEQAKRVEAANGRIERAFMEGLGQLEAVIPLGIYFRFQALFGRSCWQDDEFLRHYQKMNPGCKPRSLARKTTVRMPGQRDVSRGGGIIAP